MYNAMVVAIEERRPQRLVYHDGKGLAGYAGHQRIGLFEEAVDEGAALLGAAAAAAGGRGAACGEGHACQQEQGARGRPERGLSAHSWFSSEKLVHSATMWRGGAPAHHSLTSATQLRRPCPILRRTTPEPHGATPEPRGFAVGA